MVRMSGHKASIQALSRAMRTQLVCLCPPSLPPSPSISSSLGWPPASTRLHPPPPFPSVPPSLPWLGVSPSSSSSSFFFFLFFFFPQVSFLGLALLFLLYRRGGSPQQVNPSSFASPIPISFAPPAPSPPPSLPPSPPSQAWVLLATIWPLGKTWHLLLLGKEKGAARERAQGEW